MRTHPIVFDRVGLSALPVRVTPARAGFLFLLLGIDVACSIAPRGSLSHFRAAQLILDLPANHPTDLGLVSRANSVPTLALSTIDLGVITGVIAKVLGGLVRHTLAARGLSSGRILCRVNSCWAGANPAHGTNLKGASCL